MNNTINNLPKINKTKMYEDFDYLVYLIKNTYSQYIVKKNIMRYDIIEELRKLRKNIEQISNTKDFINLINTSLALCCDSHCGIDFNLIEIIYNNYGYKKHFSEKILSLNKKYSLCIDKQKNKLNIKCKYINGEYYNLVEFKYNGRDFKSGIKISSIDNIPINDYVRIYSKSFTDLKWDVENENFYTENVFKEIDEEKILITFIDDSDDFFSYSFNTNDEVTLLFNRKTNQLFCDVFYFDSQGVLYISLPSMANYKFYKKRILKYRKKNINKIIIDIRNNRGGNDEVWKKIVSLLIKNPIEHVITLLTLNTSVIRNFSPKKNLFISNNINSKFPIFDPINRYLNFKIREKIYPSFFNNLKYNGKVYILQNDNIFSSAGAFISFSKKINNFETVGQNGAYILGRGITPLLFKLPNSDLIITLYVVCDVTDIKEKNDIFHNKVDIQVNQGIDDYIKMYKHNELFNTKDFLLKYDECFKKVINFTD